MKTLIPVFLLFLFLASCEKEPTYCWKCNSIVYSKPITDTFCHEDIMEVENYKSRLMDFYEGAMTTIECELLPDTVK